jgi:hypothetical protein
LASVEYIQRYAKELSKEISGVLRGYFLPFPGGCAPDYLNAPDCPPSPRSPLACIQWRLALWVGVGGRYIKTRIY